jgi:hypothetical protein
VKDIADLLRAVAPLLWLIGTFVTIIFIFRKDIQNILNRFIHGKVLGQEVELSNVVAEAKSTIKELQSLSKIVASTTLSLIKRTGRLGSYSDEDEEYIKQSILDVLRQVGIPEQEQVELLKEWDQFTRFDYALLILGGSEIPRDLTSEQQEQWKKLRSGGVWNAASPQAIEEFLKQCNRLSDEAKVLIEDYKYYLEHQAHRRPKVWKDRRNWSHLR